MPQVNFISTTYFKDHVQTTVNDATIERAIADAMYKHVQHVLGTSLYNDLVNKVASSGITSAPDVYLMQNYIKPLTREYAHYELYRIKGAPQIHESGVYTNEPDKLKPAEGKELRYWRDELLHFGQQLAEDTKFYLSNNRAMFPAYQTGDEFIKPGNKGDDWFIGIS